MESTMTASERRRFSRVSFHTSAHISQGDNQWDCQLLDISLKGLLIERDGAHDFNDTEPVSAVIALGDDERICMQLQLARSEKHQMGFICQSIDVESIRHLRRLIELNSGDPEAAERELTEMILA